MGWTHLILVYAFCLLFHDAQQWGAWLCALDNLLTGIERLLLGDLRALSLLGWASSVPSAPSHRATVPTPWQSWWPSAELAQLYWHLSCIIWALGTQSWMQCSGGDLMSAEEQKSSHPSVCWLCSCGPGHSWPPLLSGHPAGSRSACRLPRAPVFLGTSPACIAARCKACFCTCWIS